MSAKSKNKIIAIVVPTASGKSDLGVLLAKKFNGEIISADSRQVYKGMNVGTGKITPSEMKGVPHHVLDIADPADSEPFTLASYLNFARQKIDDIQCRHKIPFIVGGTGLYVTALLEGYDIPEVAPDELLRTELEEKSVEKLQNIYKKIDPEGFKKIDQHNPRRLIRAIEVVKATGLPFFSQQKKNTLTNSGLSGCLVLGIHVPFEELKKKIHKRILVRYPAMLQETKTLHEQGVSWERLEGFGLEYKWMAKLAKGELKSDVALAELEKSVIAYSRRQLTWWRKRKIKWIRNKAEAEEEVKRFLAPNTKN